MVNLRDSEGRNWNVQVGGNPLKPISIELDGEIIESSNISFFPDFSLGTKFATLDFSNIFFQFLYCHS